MIDVEIGGVYSFKRKPINEINLYDCNSDSCKTIYQRTMNGRLLVITKKSGENQNLFCIYIWSQDKERPEEITFAYLQWFEKLTFLKRLRDLNDWPEVARQHFLIYQGASAGAVFDGGIEKARNSIARANRRKRMKEKEKERDKDKKNFFGRDKDKKNFFYDSLSLKANESTEKDLGIGKEELLVFKSSYVNHSQVVVPEYKPGYHYFKKDAADMAKYYKADWTSSSTYSLEDPPDIEIEFIEEEEEEME